MHNGNVKNDSDYDLPIAIRYGNNLLETDERKVFKSLIQKNGLIQNPFQPYFLEFATHFGNKMMVIKSKVDEKSLEGERECSNSQLRYCADQYVDIEFLKKKLTTLIEDGELLTKNNLSTS